MWCGGPHARLLSSPNPSSRRPKPQRVPRRVLTASRGGEQREKSSPAAGIRGKFPPEGEIDAIVTVIELDIITITIIIISTIITAVITAGHRIAMDEVRKKLFSLSLSGKAHCWLIEKLFLQLVLFEMWKFYAQHLEDSESEVFRKERDELEEIFLRQPILKHDLPVEDLGTTPPPKEDPVFDLKPLYNLKYAHIDDKKIYPVIISSKLYEIEEERLLEILKKHRGAIGYTLDDLKGISPSICQHAINMEDDAKPVVEPQRRLIPKMKEVRCEETNLVLNWEKCHFMVNEGIVLGHKISERGIEVDRAKVEAIEKMPYPRDVKDRKGADNPVADNLSRLENIAYDHSVNDSFPNEQLAVIKFRSTMVPKNKGKEFPDEDDRDLGWKEEDKDVKKEDEEEERRSLRLKSGNNSKSWDSPLDRLFNRVEHNSEMIRNLIYRIDELQELIEKLGNSSPPSPKE
ncbi:hypothetical protein QYE76_006946 [Lolium multiflorum]|uniref:Reverse transcriptase domain-containing protein n=1 Tax=Lolium multiflorum TaxID=4521 RepID=A0AAD8RVY9_LOLMU|nr:hypothetical protein QYE76_006946 [Lolium multiflorum]